MSDDSGDDSEISSAASFSSASSMGSEVSSVASFSSVSSMECDGSSDKNSDKDSDNDAQKETTKEGVTFHDNPKITVIPSSGKGLPTTKTIKQQRLDRKQVKALDNAMKGALFQADTDQLRCVFKKYLKKVKHRHKRKDSKTTAKSPSLEEANNH